MLARFEKRLFICFIFLSLFLLRPVSVRAEISSEKDYRPDPNVELPVLMNVGTSLDCGVLRLRLLANPILTKSSSGVTAEEDLEYLILRLGITNTSDEVVMPLSPESFFATELYHQVRYGEYELDYALSAKTAGSMENAPFFTPIFPGQELQTVIAFSTYPLPGTWLIRFVPIVKGSGPLGDEIEFMLPKPTRQ